MFSLTLRSSRYLKILAFLINFFHIRTPASSFPAHTGYTLSAPKHSFLVLFHSLTSSRLSRHLCLSWRYPMFNLLLLFQLETWLVVISCSSVFHRIYAPIKSLDFQNSRTNVFGPLPHFRHFARMRRPNRFHIRSRNSFLHDLYSRAVRAFSGVCFLWNLCGLGPVEICPCHHMRSTVIWIWR